MDAGGHHAPQGRIQGRHGRPPRRIGGIRKLHGCSMIYMLVRKMVPYIIGAAALVGAYFYIRVDAYNDGVEITTRKYEEAIRFERERIQVANEAALREARAREEELLSLLRARNGTIRQLQNEAESDSNAGRPALGVDSVRRLNRIR